MAQDFDLIAETRTDSGKGASRRLRHSNKVPAIVYGAGKPPRSVMFDRNMLMRKMENESFFSSVLTVKIGDKSQPVILKDVQMHPAKPIAMHLDFQRIVADEKIRMTVPIHFLNEDIAVGVKESGGTVAHLITEVEVTCLPANLPEYLELDIGELEVDATLFLSNLPLPEGVEMPELAQGLENDRGVVSIHVIKEIIEEEEVPEGEAAVEGEEAAAGEEGAPSEGDAKGDDQAKGD
jgi:large subunit ribosomal protein L25